MFSFLPGLYLPPPRPRSHAGRGRRSIGKGESMTVSLGVQQLVAGPASIKTSRAISVDTDGDNLVVELEEAGRVVLPLKEATPMVEEVELDYATDLSKAHVQDESAIVIEEIEGVPVAERFTMAEESFSPFVSNYGVLFLVLGLAAALVGVTVTLHKTLSRGKRKSESVSCV